MTNGFEKDFILECNEMKNSEKILILLNSIFFLSHKEYLNWEKTIEGLLLSEFVGTGTITNDTTLKNVVTIHVKKWVFKSSKVSFITFLGFMKPV